MKKLILSVAGFVGLSIISYVLLVILWGLCAPRILRKNISYKLGSYGYTFSRLADVKKAGKVDILCIGSSHCYRGYDPRIFEGKHLKIFNLGTSAQTPVQTELLLKEHFDELKPDFVILDVYPPVFDNDGVESTLNLIANGPIDKPLTDLALGEMNMKVYNTLIYGLFRQSLHMNTGFRQPPVMEDDTYIGSGYVQTYKRYLSNKVFKAQKVNFVQKQVGAIERTIAFLKSRNVRFVIIQAPVTRKNFESYTNNESVDSFFLRKGPYINSNYYLKLPDSLFLDDHHLNQNGVDIFDPVVLHFVDSLRGRAL
jgi:hypothetical protein